MTSIQNKVKELRTLSSDDFLALEFNTLKADKRDVTKLKNAILKGGWSFPVYVWKDNNYVIDGKGRKQAVEELIKEGHTITEIPVVDIEAKDLEEAKQKVLEVSSQYGDVTKDSFEAFTEGFDADFDTFDLKGIDEDMFIEPEEKDDEVPEVPEEPKSVLGDLYELGEHRVLCGSATSLDDVDKVTGGKGVEMLYTDPPYGMNYSGRGKNTSEGIMNDDIDPTDFYNVLPEIQERYIWGRVENHKHLLTEPRDTIIWKKNNFGMGRGYRGQYECCFYYGQFSGSDSDVWEEKRDTDYSHPTQKPVELACRAIRNSKPESVIDVFAGSGSTLLACNKMGVKSYHIELDPKYCDVIVQRYVDYTGNTTIKRNGVEEEWEVTVK